jgi:hypothetical protein
MARMRARSVVQRSALAAVLASSGLFIAVMPARAAWPECLHTARHNLYAGDNWVAGGLRGVQARIEWFNTQLCIQDETPDDSWSLSWVGIVGPNSPTADGFDIFQGGFARCATSGTAHSCPYNGGVSYHWWFWEYEAGPCGLAANSGFRKANKGNAGPGTYTYRIDYRPGVSPPRYSFQINGADQTWISTTTVSTCWGGVSEAQLLNEMLDEGDQNGGTVADHQEYSQAKWEDVSEVIRTITWPLGTPCDANSQPSAWTCNISGSTQGLFVTWDRRAP